MRRARGSLVLGLVLAVAAPFAAAPRPVAPKPVAPKPAETRPVATKPVAPVTAPAPVTITVEPGTTVEAVSPRGIRVRIAPRKGETWAALARRVTGRFANAEVVRAQDPAVMPDAERMVEVPFELLTDARKREAVAALLPGDRCEGSTWVHKPVPSFAADGSFETLAAWFSSGDTGRVALEVALRSPEQGVGGLLRLPCVGLAPWLAEARGCCTSLTREESEDMTEAGLGETPVLDLLLAPEPPERKATVTRAEPRPAPRVEPHAATTSTPHDPRGVSAVTATSAGASAGAGAKLAPSAGSRTEDLLAGDAGGKEPLRGRSPVDAIPEPAPRKAGEGTTARADADAVAGVPASSAPRAPVTGAATGLTYGADDKGAYAAYRLHAGEAIYSDVIVRFTGRVHASDVNEIVPVIAERSQVRSFETLPVGFEVKIPLDLLAPEFRPESDEKRRDYERRRREVAQFRNRSMASHLAGVVVILDAGHGGRDRGAASDDVWESDYVYDIVSRIKTKLETTTKARVFATVRNESLGFKPRDRKRLTPEPDAFVLTRPPYRLEDPVLGVNLRWYLSNSIYRNLVKSGTEPSKVVFTSVHADSLHPTVRGAMVYVPAEEYTGGRHGRSAPSYQAFREVREEPVFEFTERERQEAEGLSRELATRLLETLEQRGLPIHEESPIRGSVLRDGREWLPAVLRSNRVPARILFEVCNLNHAADNELLESPAFRQAVADAYVDALLRYYGDTHGAVVAERR